MEFQHADRKVRTPGWHENGDMDSWEALQYDILAELVNQLKKSGIVRQGHRQEVCIFQLCLLLLAQELNLSLTAIDLLLLSRSQPNCILLILSVWHNNTCSRFHFELLLIASPCPHDELMEHSGDGHLQHPLVTLKLHFVIQLPLLLILLLINVLATFAFEAKVLRNDQLPVGARTDLDETELRVFEVLGKCHGRKSLLSNKAA
mmetsp:Transcript_10279/g.29050  ORF Transcript_10279/g.29050 Transcript_10279/m.29050 type:complete len:204 (+) Transcript_10279:621-1232(+)